MHQGHPHPWRPLRLIAASATAVLLAGLVVTATTPRATAVVDVNDCWSTDNTDPVIDDFSLEPAAIDVTTGPKTVSFTIAATDSAAPGGSSGEVKRGKVELDAPKDRPGLIAVLRPDATGDLTATVTFPTWSLGGTWLVRNLTVVDGKRNQVRVDAADFPADFPTELEVTATGPNDDDAPELEGISVRPKTVDSTKAVRSVLVTVRATDDISGINDVFVTAASARDEDVFSRAHLAKVTGTASTYRGELKIRRWAGTSRWHVVEVFLEDRVENSSAFDQHYLDDHGFSTAFKVISNGDIGSPKPIGLRLDPTQIDVRNADGFVTVEVRATDTKSGLKNMFARLDPASGPGRSRNLKLVSGDRDDGWWSGDIRLPRCRSVQATYRLTIGMVDRAGNNPVYEANQLRNRGFPSRVQVQALDHEWPELDIATVGTTGLSVAFSEDVTGISNASAPIREDGGVGPDVAGTWACKDAADQTVDCVAGAVRTAAFTPDTPWTDGQSLGVVTNPEGNLDATDLAGNPLGYRVIYPFTA
jgi:hypothetical protein